jgi:hypothetical protein
LSLYLSFCQSPNLSVCLSVCLSVRLSFTRSHFCCTFACTSCTSLSLAMFFFYFLSCFLIFLIILLSLSVTDMMFCSPSVALYSSYTFSLSCSLALTFLLSRIVVVILSLTYRQRNMN